MAKAKYYENKQSGPLLIYFKSIGKSLIITVVVMLIIAAIVTYTSLPEKVMPLITSIIMVLSIALSGLFSAARLEKRGFMQGLLTGAIYILFILFLSWVLVNDFSVDRFTIMKGTIGILSGGVGGMIGVNLK